MDFTGMFGKVIMGSRFGLMSESSWLTWSPVTLVVVVVLGVFWLWMLVDCLKRNFKKDNEKLVWVIVLLFAHLIGAFLYYFIVKAKKR
ncbi:MAG: PLD nuclease N-terminal domain-containing protein [Nanoarchaeota archaeon]|nr:PLD nuclease N-terminal domain-containing protein [Nanoarchaeota archaeon]